MNFKFNLTFRMDLGFRKKNSLTCSAEFSVNEVHMIVEKKFQTWFFMTMLWIDKKFLRNNTMINIFHVDFCQIACINS
jgi:hypothetical protein